MDRTRLSVAESGIQVGDFVVLDRGPYRQYGAKVERIGKTRVLVSFRYKYQKGEGELTEVWAYPLKTPDHMRRRVG